MDKFYISELYHNKAAKKYMTSLGLTPSVRSVPTTAF